MRMTSKGINLSELRLLVCKTMSKIVKLPFLQGLVQDKSNIQKDFRKALSILILSGLSSIVTTALLFYLNYP